MGQPLTIAAAFELARECVDAGELVQASAICTKILEADSCHAPALHLLGFIAYRQGARDAAVKWLRRAVASDATLAAPWNDLGNLLAERGSADEAIACYRRALALRPDYPESHNNLGNLYQMTGALDDAVNCYAEAIRLRPDYAEARRNLGSALSRLGRLTDAAAAFEAAISLNPGYAEAAAQLAGQMLHLCDWRPLNSLTGKLIEAVETGSAAVNPFVFLSLETTERQQFLCARRWAAQNGWTGAAAPPSVTSGRDRITLGYLSADFEEHATAHLIAELFPLHDRSRFRVFGYSYRVDDGSAIRRRLADSVDRFVDLERASHEDAAARIRADGVDILVDLKGYTTNARPGIPALRPAPIQVSYLGYPGTLGSDALDYIVVDPFVVPADRQPHFTEHLVHLPDCYQVNDRRRPIASRIPTRSECGLPSDGFVFCCFNASNKITPKMFDIWMRLLDRVPASVLWLLASNPEATDNLRREADARLDGGADRLVFAPKIPNPEHLARFAIADLFLDTLPYNAHTLASDALWGGCPVVTCAGSTFPSRVAGSLLHSVGLQELVTGTLADYEALALALAESPERLASIRARLRANRLTAPLFDTPRFTRHLERAFETMWRFHQAGETPRAFAVDPLPATWPAAAG